MATDADADDDNGPDGPPGGPPLAAFARAATWLDGLLRGSLGPHGAHKVLTSATGRVLVTKHGGAVLDALDARGSRARALVLSAARAHARAYGDGSIGFVLMLAEALRRIDACIAAGALGGATRARLTRALEHVVARWLPDVALPTMRLSLIHI